MHYFRGSFGGKDIVPLYRDGLAREPNLTKGLAGVIAKQIGISAPSVEDVASYTYALLSSLRYQERFSYALKTPGPRVPFTAEKDFWDEAVSLGKYLLWLHTFGNRFQNVAEGRGKHIPFVSKIGWEQAVNVIPEDMADVSYDVGAQLLRVGNGLVAGVRPDVWAYSVSNIQIIKK